MLLLSTFIFATIIGVRGQCSLKEEAKVDGICRANIICDVTTGNMMNIVKTWDCIKTGRRYYNEYGHRDYGIDSNYNLYLNVRNIDIDISEDPLVGLIDASTQLINLNIETGNLVSVPIVIGSLLKLTKLSLTYNKIEIINLRKVSSGGSLKFLNISHNCISTIEEDLVENSVSSLLTTIDLSYNLIELLPENCFARFTNLKYLNLTSNLFKQFDILTFEGIAQLEILQLSNNKISELGQIFARFRKLKELTLDNNQLTYLSDLNFRPLVSLEKLNLSSNLIKNIEDQSLATLKNLKQLDLSHNKITVIHQTLFKSNINIYKLSLSYNDIEHVEGGAFRTTNISYFDVENNHFSGIVEYDTFLGICVESLDLSNGKLTELGDKAFSSLSSNLKYLNLSTNLLENVTKSAFDSLQNLLKLDLSHNNLVDISFNISNLNQLTDYYLQNNRIKYVSADMFKNMTSLVKLDLSQNKIADIETNSFIELVNLQELDIRNNDLANSLTANIFRGLYKVKSLDLSNMRLMSCLNNSFYGMVSLTYLNVSHSQLETIEYDTFKGTGSIGIIDLSYNILENFHINTSSISQLSELYLNNNKLKNVTNETFKNLRLLQKLSLVSNSIIYIDSEGLLTLSHLRYLNLFSNSNLLIKSDIFNNLILSEVSLSKIQQRFNFKNAVNASITTLILSNCEIEDMNSVFIHSIHNVLELDISLNKIKALDKGSFQNMADLNWLDISFNMISTIKPGTFLTNKMINTLNLYGNNLQYLQFGVLDGLGNLRVLNLSNNELHTFGINLLHRSPYLTELLLENNNLQTINLKELSETSVSLLTIGGNSISCDALADWNKLNVSGTLNITAESFDYNSENIYGISCKTNSLQNKVQNDNTNVNIKGEVIEIKQTVQQLYSYLRTSLNETFSNLNAFLENVPEHSDKVSANLNHSQQIFNEQFKNFLNENKKMLPHLVNTNDNVANDIKLMIYLLEINNNLTRLSNIHKELLQTPLFNETVHRQENPNSLDTVPIVYDAQPLEVNSDKNTLADIKVLLYFIAVCIAVVILFSAVALTYKYFYRQSSYRIRKNPLYDSGQSVRNNLEME